MLYLLYGENTYLINQEAKSIIEVNHIERINVSEYDFEEILCQRIIEDAETLSLFDTKKVIIVNNATFFKALDKVQDVTIIEKYLENPNPNCIMIFKLNSPKIDSRKKVVVSIKKNGVVKEFTNTNDVIQIVKDLFIGYNIDNKSIMLLIERVGKDIGVITQAIEKIKTYKDNDHNITNEDIVNLTSKNIDVDIFELINSIISNNKEKAISIYNEMLKYNEEPIKLIITLAKKFRLMYQTKELYKKGYTENDIAKNLSESPAHIHVLNNISRNYSADALLKYIDMLADIDYQIKSGIINKNIALELFILQK